MAFQRYDQEDIAIYWDYDTIRSTSASSTVSTYDLVKNIRAAIAPFGSIKSFRAYADFSGSPTMPLRSPNIRSELSSSGVSLVDCPCDGRKDLSMKIMLVDILINAWDHPPPYTFLIITGDRDLAYAVSTLRTRKYRVVVICPAATHLDLTAQASTQLDWSQVALGMVGGPTDSPEPPLPPKERPISAFGMRRQSETTNDNRTQYASTARKSASNDRGILSHSGLKPNPAPQAPGHNEHLRGRRNSFFSSYDARKYSVFGDMDLDYPATSVGIGSFGLGDGPLFPRTRSQGGEQSRADSAPPNIQYSTNPSTPHAEIFQLASSTKGKQKEAQINEPENIFPLIPAEFPQNVPYAGTMFEPFGSADPFQLSNSPPPKTPSRQTADKLPVTLSMSPSSKSDSLAMFSTMHTETVSTAPTSAQPPSLADKSDLTIKPSSSNKKDISKFTPPPSNGVFAPSRQTSSESTESVFGSATADKIDEYTKAKKEDKSTSPLVHELGFNPMQQSSTIAESSATVTEPKVSTPPVVQSKPAMPLTPPVVHSKPAMPLTPPVASATKPRAATPVTLPPKKPSSNTASTPIPASRSSTPQVTPTKYATLIQILRDERHRFPHGVPKSTLGAALLKKNANVYKQAGFSKFGQYIASAVAGSVVLDKFVDGEACVALHPSLT